MAVTEQRKAIVAQMKETLSEAKRRCIDWLHWFDCCASN